MPFPLPASGEGLGVGLSRRLPLPPAPSPLAERGSNKVSINQPLQGCDESLAAFLFPGFQSKHSHPTRAARVGTPAWLDQRFQRYIFGLVSTREAGVSVKPGREPQVNVRKTNQSPRSGRQTNHHA